MQSAKCKVFAAECKIVRHTRGIAKFLQMVRWRKKLCILHFALCIFLATSCRSVAPVETRPLIQYQATARQIEKLPTAFLPLDADERASDWGRELTIGKAFGKELDLYRATTAFKRAQILIGEGNEKRRDEIFYDMLLAYYLAGKTDEVCELFEKSNFTITSEFPATRELLLILYDSYFFRGQKARAQAVNQYIEKASPELYAKVARYTKLALKDIQDPSFDALSNAYQLQRKSPFKAGLYNALLPGAGYLYVGQSQTALTSLTINAVFIAATLELYHAGYIATAIIAGSIECGWYIGGINGCVEHAKNYNKSLYAVMAHDYAAREKLFPVQLFQYGF